MSATDIGWTGLAGALVLVVVAVALSLANGLRLERTILWAATRAAAQLLVVGSGLALVFGAGGGASVALALAWVAAMVVVAALTVRARAREVPSAFPLALAAIGAVAVVSLGTVFGLGVFPLQAPAIIPLAGMNVGNAMAATVVVARRIVAELADKRLEIEARLALGHSGAEATRPYVRAAMRTALLPQIESTKTVGLIALPGAMTGLILAGVPPRQAVMVQVAVMYLILGSVTTSVTVVGLGLTRRLLTADHRLVRVDRTTT
jgi:putative ABC transport system permease protein